LNIVGNHLNIIGLKDQKITRTEQEYQGKENLMLEDLENCTVVMPFAVKCVYMKNIHKCRIYVGVCSGATFVDKAIDCKILI
jgi:hypothetical protein